MKVIILGFDGATFSIIKLHLDDLPNFRFLLNNGVHAEMMSTIPPVSAPAWTSMFTGKNPAKHNIFGFFDKNFDCHGI